MELYTTLLVLLLLAPLGLSLVMFALLRTNHAALRLADGLHLLGITATLILGLGVIGGVLRFGAITALNDWLHVDALAAVFLGIVSVVGFLVGLYSLGHVRHDLETGALTPTQYVAYYGLFNLVLFTMLLVVTANNIIMMWVAVEATTLGSTFLVGIYGRRSSLEAAWKYVMICTVGVAFGLYGTILVYSDAVNYMREPHAAVLWTEIVKNAAALDPTLLKLAFVFILIGFGTKAGIFPMHAWLPDAYSESPSPVSALLSGAMINCGMLVIIRFAIILNQNLGPGFTQTIFLAFGTVSIAAAALFMFVQRDLNRLLAYSSVENIGLIVLALGIGGPAGILAALMHTVNHSLAKALIFMTSGNILIKYHSRDLAKIHGMLQAIPFSSILLLVGVLTLAGAPPFNIFLSKFSIIAAGIGSGHVWLMLVGLLFLTIAFTAFLRMLSGSIFGDPPADVPAGEVRAGMLVPIVILMAMIITLGLYLPPQYTSLLGQAVDTALAGAGVAGMPGFLGPQAVLPAGILQIAGSIVH